MSTHRGSSHRDDRHYTPRELARVMTKYARTSPRVVADLACGDGSLLAAAEERWSDRLGSVRGSDVSRSVIAGLQSMYPRWSLGTADAFRQRSRSASPIWRGLPEVDLLLLNPPFSHRGGQGVRVAVGLGRHHALSPGVALIQLAVSQLSQGAEVVAILPSNSVRNLQDEPAIDLWRRFHRFSIGDELPSSTFDNVRASSILVRLEKGAGPSTDPASPPLLRRLPERPEGCRCITVRRGRVKMHRVRGIPRSASSVELFHTTQLSNRTPVENNVPAAFAHSAPFVTLPRVGLPNESQVQAFHRSVALSDCVFALTPCLDHNVDSLVNDLRSNLSVLRAAYHGSCAAYLTIGDVCEVLRAMGWHPVTATCECGCR
ncbi:N-6 DNA methylase [Phycicoccus sonneratiae]|uniref:N-6 DNA methylase n=1 Tax=Phycicoccus sonneratiae TaxID=2807628 RepID=A0ABS2CRH8_9MICO|nr:N-6 DNA methylase [Phycicoccus sonneraticus]